MCTKRWRRSPRGLRAATAPRATTQRTGLPWTSDHDDARVPRTDAGAARARRRGEPLRRRHRHAAPGGTVVLLDGLVQMLGDPAVVDDRVLAVLGHELGHVAPRHVLRRLLQTAAVYLAATVPRGDTARPAASGPVLLNALGYPRDLEREADDPRNLS